MLRPAVVRTSADGTCPGATAAVEVYDRASGRTFAMYPPNPVFGQ
jgi:hypothetical protein